MTARQFSLLAAIIFAVMALLQLARAISGWPVMVGTTEVPLWLSWLAVVVAAVLSFLGFQASRR